MAVRHDELPPVHRDYVVAAMGYGLRSGEGISRSHRVTPLDVPWAQISMRNGPPTPRWRCECLECKRGLHLVGVDEFAANRRVLLQFEYVPLPATMQAFGPPKRVGYWFSQCLVCRNVFWMADDGQWDAQRAAAGEASVS